MAITGCRAGAGEGNRRPAGTRGRVGRAARALARLAVAAALAPGSVQPVIAQQGPSVRVKEAAGQRFGFDAFTDPANPWKSVALGAQDDMVFATVPAAGHTRVVFVPAAALTIRPSRAAASAQRVTVAGLQPGRSSIQIRHDDAAGTLLREVRVAVYRPQVRSVAVRLVHEENDDVQRLPVGHGEPNQPAITPGTNGRLDTRAQGDDRAELDVITSGADGRVETDAAGDDEQVLANGNGLAGAICVTPGSNRRRDTRPRGDDQIAGQSITAGPDGICDTPANSTNVQSTPVHMGRVRSYLNTVIYNQAATTWQVVELSPMTINFDLDWNGVIDVDKWMSDEMIAVRKHAAHRAYDYNIFLVDNPSDGSLGYMQFGQRYGFVHPDETAHPANTVAHELGHGAFSLVHTPNDRDNLMHPTAANPSRLRQWQWDLINP